MQTCFVPEKARHGDRAYSITANAAGLRFPSPLCSLDERAFIWAVIKYGLSLGMLNMGLMGALNGSRSSALSSCAVDSVSLETDTVTIHFHLHCARKPETITLPLSPRDGHPVFE